MEVKIYSKSALSEQLIKELESRFGFECILDHAEEGDYLYFFGYPIESVGEEGCCPTDPLPYEEAVEVCGWLHKRGIKTMIDGDAGWATSMYRRVDYSGFSMSDSEKDRYVRLATMFWAEADPSKVSQIQPSAKNGGGA